jgi:hypothetical protein
MFGKILAGILMGIVAAVLATMVFGLGVGGGESGGRTGLWAALGGFLVTLGLAVTAERGRYAWGRGMLLCGLLCFALPLAGMLFSGIVGGKSIAGAASGAEKAGATIGTVMAGGVITLVSGVFGFFMGVIFLVGSYFTLRSR